MLNIENEINLMSVYCRKVYALVFPLNFNILESSSRSLFKFRKVRRLQLLKVMRFCRNLKLIHLRVATALF